MSTIELPTKDDVEQHMAELESRGVTSELRCTHCDELTEATVLPGESVDVTICRSCATDHARKAGLI